MDSQFGRGCIIATRTWTGTTSGDWGVTTNWLEGSVPGALDSVYFYNNSVSVTAGLDQHTVTLTSLTIDSSYTGTIGTSTTFLQIGATNVTIGGTGASGSQGSGSQRLNLNLGSGGSTVTILSSANSGADTGEPPIRLLGSSLVVNDMSGYVGIGTEAGDAASCTAVRTGASTNGSTIPPTIYVGQGSTVTTWNIGSGSVVDASSNASTTILLTGGSYKRIGSGACTTLTVDAGTAQWQGTGTITNAFVTGKLDFSGDTRSKTVTNCTAYKGATINANNGNPNSIAFTNGIILKGCRMSDITLDVGYDRTVSIS